MLKAILATGNADKVIEIAAILRDVELQARPTHLDDVDEVGETLEENARLKARAVLAATGTLSIADDTGLEVEALNGAPGVRTSRFAGDGATYDDNVRKMLEVMSQVPLDKRKARFRTVALACFPDGRELCVEGVLEGSIALGPLGSGGFGYDPIFIPAESQGLTLAQLTFEDKNAISHRGRAFRALAKLLAE
jgi:XTP/dITP diphosphohydrolase